jgi:hypothetical protein
MDALNQLADAIRQRNQAEDRIATIVGRPVSAGTLYQFVACRVFDIDLDGPDCDVLHGVGRFCSGPLAGRSVAVRRTGVSTRSLDITIDPLPDFILVMACSDAVSVSPEFDARPSLVDRVYLFDAGRLVAELEGRGRKVGAGTVVDRLTWQAAEIYPQQRSGHYLLSGAQRHALGLFGPEIKFG